MLGIVIIQLLTAISASPSTTPPMQAACDGSFPSVLRESPLVTFQFEPEPFQSSFNFISWRNFREDRAQVTLIICDFTWIAGLSFETLNVKHYNVSVDGQVHSGGTDQSGKVELSFGRGSWTSFRVGWKIRITVEAEEQFMPVEIRNLEIKTCQTYFDCFESCALYILQSNTGCKKPMCKGDPCSRLRCPENQECRLIPDEPRNTFPSVMTPGVQLWGCVNKDRTDYGCFCESYTPGLNGCPTCECGGNLTTTTTLAPQYD